MLARVTLANFLSIPKTGRSDLPRAQQIAHFTSRIPENCAHTSVKRPEALTNPPQITADSPRPYGLLNSGLVVVNPSLELFGSLKHSRNLPKIKQ